MLRSEQSTRHAASKFKLAALFWRCRSFVHGAQYVRIAYFIRHSGLYCSRLSPGEEVGKLLHCTEPGTPCTYSVCGLACAFRKNARTRHKARSLGTQAPFCAWPEGTIVERPWRPPPLAPKRSAYSHPPWRPPPQQTPPQPAAASACCGPQFSGIAELGEDSRSGLLGSVCLLAAVLILRPLRYLELVIFKHEAPWDRQGLISLGQGEFQAGVEGEGSL